MIVLYWIDQDLPCSLMYKDSDLTVVLNEAKRLRTNQKKHVCISSEPENCTTLMGVDSIEDGLTPEGEKYGWTKRR